MLTYPWKCTVLHCNHLGNTWKPLVLITRHFDYCLIASEGDNQSVRSSAPVVSRCFPGGYNVKLNISRGRLAWWLLAFLHSVGQYIRIRHGKTATLAFSNKIKIKRINCIKENKTIYRSRCSVTLLKYNLFVSLPWNWVCPHPDIYGLCQDMFVAHICWNDFPYIWTLHITLFQFGAHMAIFSGKITANVVQWNIWQNMFASSTLVVLT